MHVYLFFGARYILFVSRNNNQYLEIYDQNITVEWLERCPDVWRCGCLAMTSGSVAASSGDVTKSRSHLQLSGELRCPCSHYHGGQHWLSFPYWDNSTSVHPQHPHNSSGLQQQHQGLCISGSKVLCSNIGLCRIASIRILTYVQISFSKHAQQQGHRHQTLVICMSMSNTSIFIDEMKMDLM